ncbi:MAG: hypothetical protein H5U40_03730, partial [Polyangiaceae bacterium]|nr:hypothetical protein [Polyangiaceae bacterium]
MAERRDTTREDPLSDLIHLDSGIASIPDHVEIVPTPEELRQMRIFRALKIAAAAVVIASVVFGAYGFLRARSRGGAIAEALEGGRALAFERAISLTDDENTLGWLDGALSLTRTEAERTGASAGPHAGDGSLDGKLAGTYAKLLGGDVAAAFADAEALELTGDFASEAIFLQSLAAEATGRLEAAVARASVAHQLRPSSSRYLARWSTALTRAGHPDDALARLDRANGESPDIALARARAELAKPGDPTRALEAAQRVLAAEDANPAEKSWAYLINALAQLRGGHREQASTAIDAARAKMPVADELFRIRLSEALLALGRATEAGAA